MSEIDLRRSWNRLSADYQQECRLRTDTAHYGVCAPNEDVLGLLGEVAGRRILELGCGGGQCSIAFAKQGAFALGVDLSDTQIAYACALAEREGVSVAFHQGKMEEFLEGEPDAGYDVVFSAYAFQYVGDLSRVFRETRRVLKPGGLFVFSLDHPISDVTAWDEGRAVFAESYFARGRMEWTWGHGPRGEEDPFYSFHRTTGDFLNLLVAAGFVVEQLLEPEPPPEEDPWARAEDRQRYATLPATIIWKARVGCGVTR
ncbi:MAG: methyltransferase domain-containing protein [Verrucomicrobia bacterium]|nr:methyltransferase domain-containing protein [Verrucomicrobiota bacterium]